MADVARMLELMHPLREPPPPSPVAPYLVMLAVGCIAAVAGLVLLVQARRRGADLRRSALAALAASRTLVPEDRLAAQAALLRRLARRLGGEAAGRRHGRPWLEGLDAMFGTPFFTQGEGQAYGDALYARRPAVDIEALDRSLAGLIAKLPSRRGTAARRIPA